MISPARFIRGLGAYLFVAQIALSGAQLACAPTETGNPPARVESNLISLSYAAPELTVVASGSAGAVSPAPAEVFLFDLERESDLSAGLVRVDVDGDGAFAGLALSSSVLSTVRLWADSGGGPSSALDYVLAPSEPLRVAELSCLRVEPEVISTGSSLAVRYLNECGAEVPLSPDVRGGALDFVPALPTTLAAGESVSVEVLPRDPGTEPSVVEIDSGVSRLPARLVVYTP